MTHFTWSNMKPTLELGHGEFLVTNRFCVYGLELVSAMSEEVRDPRRTLPRAVFGAGAMIAFMYIVGTFAILPVPAGMSTPKSGVLQRYYGRFYRSQDRCTGDFGRPIGFRRERRWCRQHCRRYCTRAVCCWDRPLSTRGVWERFILNGRHRTFPFLCKREFLGRFCC